MESIFDDSEGLIVSDWALDNDGIVPLYYASISTDNIVGYAAVTFNDHDIVPSVIMVAKTSNFVSVEEEIKQAILTLNIEDQKEPVFGEANNEEILSSTTSDSSDTKNEYAEESKNASDVTVSQKNALRKATSYLSMMAFSHDGLVEQLEYEGFDHDDAVYGADHCNADWKEQAAIKAKDYLDMTAFSHDGLIEQLEYEGFTPEQAEYGVNSVGL